MKLNIQKAARTQRKAKICLAGPSGSGKTMTALRVARGLVGDAGKILVLDTERGSASLYSDVTDYDVAELPNFLYDTYISGIKEAEKLGYDCLVIDSLSHAWQEFLDQHTKMQGNSYVNWSKITPKYNELIQAIVNYSGHIIVTMRAKTKYEMDEKNRPSRQYIGTIMRDGTEYEFDVVGMISIDHNMTIEKSRIAKLQDRIITKPGEDFGVEVAEWLGNAPAKSPINVKPAPVVKEKKVVDMSQIIAKFHAIVSTQVMTEETAIQSMPNRYEFPEGMTPEEKLAILERVIPQGGCYSKQMKCVFSVKALPLMEKVWIEWQAPHHHEENATVEMMEAE